MYFVKDFVLGLSGMDAVKYVGHLDVKGVALAMYHTPMDGQG